MGDDILFNAGLNNLYVSVDGEEFKPLNTTPKEFNPEVNIKDKEQDWHFSNEFSVNFKPRKSKSFKRTLGLEDSDMRISKKKFKKLLMSIGYSRNQAEHINKYIRIRNWGTFYKIKYGDEIYIRYEVRQ